MELEPQIEPIRDTEALLIAVDTSASKKSFKSLQQAAFRLARTRLLYPISKDDLIGVLQAGSEKTDNPLAKQEPSGYQGIQVHVPLISASLRAVRSLNNLEHHGCSTHLLNLLDVAGDSLVSAAALRSRRKRLLIFTTDKSKICSLPTADDEDFIATCNLYAAFENDIRVDVIIECSSEQTDTDISHYDDLFYDEASDQNEEVLPTPKASLEKASQFACKSLLALAKCTGGLIMSLSTANPMTDKPAPRAKRASVKFHGVLDIADKIQIPVKKYSYVLEAKHPPGKKISWEESIKCAKYIPVLVETNRVASTKDDTPLEPEEIVNAFSYGPDLVPEQHEVDSYAWSMHMDRGLDVIGFVSQASVPQHMFIGRVDAVIAMKESPEAIRLLKTVVLAMHAEKLGILARSVTPARGGAPSLCYLWPRIELSSDGRTVRNCFLFSVDVPMREDIRDLPFASLEDELEDTLKEAFSAMNDFISCSMLDGNNQNEKSEEEEDESEEDDEEGKRGFSPTTFPNPNLDWFNNCIVHRALQGPSGTGFPELSEWHKKLISPESFLAQVHKVGREQAVRSLKIALPIAPAKKREKKGRRVHTALNGDLASIVDYLPEEGTEWDADGDQNSDGTNVVSGLDEVDEVEDEGSGDEIVAERLPEAAPIWDNDDNLQDDMVSNVTDRVALNDVGSKTPVEDFKHLVNKGQFRFAALSLQVMLRRLIRGCHGNTDSTDADDNKTSMKCLQALRIACYEHKESRFFNDFITSMIQRCDRQDSIGKRTEAFFRYVGIKEQVHSTLDMIPLAIGASSSIAKKTNRDNQHAEFVKEMSEAIAKLTTQEAKSTPSLSEVHDESD